MIPFKKICPAMGAEHIKGVKMYFVRSIVLLAGSMENIRQN